jgi:hypothetical protein
MAPERRPPDDPREWLNRAKSNLGRAKADIRLPGVYLEDLCFLYASHTSMILGLFLPSSNRVAHPFQSLSGKQGA